MADVRVFSGARVVADYMIDEENWDDADGAMPTGEAEVIAHAKKAVVKDGHLSAEEAETATYMVSAD